MPGPVPYTDIGGGGPNPPHGEDFFNRIVNVHWPKKGAVGRGCRFAVCGYDGNYQSPPYGDPVFFGVGAYSNDGKSWTLFRVFENGSTVSVFSMIDPLDVKQNMVVVGGCTNLGDFSAESRAELTTVAGSGFSATGGTSVGGNVANFGSLGYDKANKAFYAVENSGSDISGTGQHQTLHTFQPDVKPIPQEPSIFWAGAHYPGIEPVYDCTTGASLAGEGESVMKFVDKDGNEHFLSIAFYGALTMQLQLDGENITPPGSRGVASAAGGVNDKGETIIIAMAYSLKGTTADHGIAWWSVDGKGWNEIEGLWTGEPALQAAQMATAVPI